MNDVPKIPELINEAMERKDLGVNALSRAAQQRELPLSSSTISLYRRGQLPKTVPSETLDAFSVLLDIPKEDLYQAAYGDTTTADEIAARTSLSESLGQLPERQQKLVRQLIHELARKEDPTHESNVIASVTPGRFQATHVPSEFDQIAARNRREGDPGLDEDVPLDDA